MDKAFDLKIAEPMLNKVRDELELNKYSVSSHKVLVILGGQPGAGKSTITKLIEDKYSGNIVFLNGDDFKTYYPNYRELLKSDPNKTAEIVQPYSNFVVNRLQKELMEKGYNLIIEGTMRSATAPLNSAKVAKDLGYTVEAYVISVNEHASKAGCILRAENDLAITGAGRTVNPQSHDEAYKNIPNTLQSLVNSKLFDNIIIYNREGSALAELIKNDDVVARYVQNRDEVNGGLFKSVCEQINQAKALIINRQGANQELHGLEQIKEDITNKFMRYEPKIIDSPRNINAEDKIKTPSAIEVSIQPKSKDFER